MSERATVDRLRAGFMDPPAEARPMIRWWWFGPAVERDELERELTAISAAGFGGVEVAFVYPLSSVQNAFLSTEFCQVLRFAAQTAVRLGLRFSLTLGSGCRSEGHTSMPRRPPGDCTGRSARDWARSAVGPGRGAVAG